MLNEDDLRPGDLIVDAMNDVWHVHEDGNIWCSEPGARISFETANGACGPFKYAPGADSLLYRAERAERERDAAIARAEQAERGAWRVRYQQAVADLLDAGRSRDEWKDRAEKAEADLEELSEEFADFRVEVVAEAVKYRELNPPVFDVDVERTIRAEFVEEGFRAKTPVEYRVVRAVCELFGVKAEPTVDQIEDVALIISAGMFHKESSPELVREIAQEVVDYFKEENDG